MKKIIVSLAFVLSMTVGYSQEKKPTIMILPSDAWCNHRYFTTTFTGIGGNETVSDYATAFKEDAELHLVISDIGGLMTGLGYNLKDSEQELKAISMRSSEDNMTFSKTTGASLVETPLDILNRRSKADILIQVDWTVNKEISGKSVSFILEAFDTYTSKRIATATGVSSPSQESVPRILMSAVSKQMEQFDIQLTQYFRTIKNQGREIVLQVRCWDSWENDLETEYNGEELTDCILSWLESKAVSKAFNLSDATESLMFIEQLKIPLEDEKGRPVDARSFANDLRKYLQNEPFNITSKVVTRGLGEAVIILGEK